jgi:hypothetical protein
MALRHRLAAEFIGTFWLAPVVGAAVAGAGYRFLTGDSGGFLTGDSGGPQEEPPLPHAAPVPAQQAGEDRVGEERDRAAR